MSGLIRLSDVGPREEKQAMPSGLSDTWPAAAMVGNSSGPPPAERVSQLASIPGVGVDPCGRLFSVAPTVRQFFAVAGVPTDPGSITASLLASLPALPAAKRTSASRCVDMNWSTARELSE
jgi:hypothetical protein